MADTTHQDTGASEQPENMQPMFVNNPIVAIQSESKQYLIEEIFRSQIKLISDTVAKEFFFILEFFDFKINNQTQQTFMFNKIFKHIISKYWVDKLKENCDGHLFDVYSCLIMI